MLIRYGRFKTKKDPISVLAAIAKDYCVSENAEQAVAKIKSNPMHYIHPGWTIDAAGGSIRLTGRNDEISESDPIVVGDVVLKDVTDYPPKLDWLKSQIDSKDFLVYCGEYLSAKDRQLEVLK